MQKYISMLFHAKFSISRANPFYEIQKQYTLLMAVYPQTDKLYYKFI